MNRRKFLKNIPFIVVAGVVALPKIANADKLPLGYISSKAIKIRNEINKRSYSSGTPEESKQLINELLYNSNPTAEQFEKMFDKCIISAETLYRLSADGFKMKGK